MNFSQCIQIIRGLFPALVREDLVDWKAHEPQIILKIEVQQLKEWTVC